MTTAVVLAGGLGTRLRTVVSDRPKSMALIAGRPFLEWQLEVLKDKGVDECVFAVGYLAEHIQSHFGRRFNGLDLRYSIETSPLGTGGALRQALQQSDREEVFVLNGDTLIDYPLDQLLQAVRVEFTEAAVAVVKANVANRYGTVIVDDSLQIRGFEEKSPVPSSPWINSGTYCLRKSRFLEHKFPEVFSIEKAYFEQMCNHLGIRAVTTDSKFIDIGIPDDFATAQSFIPELAERIKGIPPR
jgi:D-glycero-alpha-D-manno-heptose 1-phosphate guanylyltransferase